MREQRVALEHHRRAARGRRQVGDVLGAEEDVADRHASRGRRSCAASRSCRSPTGRAGSNRCRRLILRSITVDGHRRAVALGDGDEFDVGGLPHARLLPAVGRVTGKARAKRPSGAERPDPGGPTALPRARGPPQSARADFESAPPKCVHIVYDHDAAIGYERGCATVARRRWRATMADVRDVKDRDRRQADGPIARRRSGASGFAPSIPGCSPRSSIIACRRGRGCRRTRSAPPSAQAAPSSAPRCRRWPMSGSSSSSRTAARRSPHPTVEEARQVFEVRSLLEPRAAALAAGRGDARPTSPRSAVTSRRSTRRSPPTTATAPSPSRPRSTPGSPRSPSTRSSKASSAS